MNPTHVDKFLNIRTGWHTWFKCPSFAFGTDGARGPCVLTSLLGPMADTVRVSLLRLLDRWRTGFLCPSFAFGTDGARGSVFFGPNQGG